MRYLGYKIILALLRIAMFAKRGLFWIGGSLRPTLDVVVRAYNNSLGFWLYKLYFLAKRRLQKISVPWEKGFVYVLGKRTALQLMLFAAATIVMIPHTKLYTVDTNVVPGRNTVLYALVGPGEQDFQLEEIEVDVTVAPKGQARPWEETALNVQTQPGVSGSTISEPQQITSIGAGGTALTKPTIISETPERPQPATPTTRDAIAVHTVQSGETIGNIAQRYSVSIETILWANSLTARSYIRPGDKLKILPTTGVMHKVQRGDTVGKIARKYSAKEEDIIRVNQLKPNGTDIIIGEELIVPNGKPIAAVVVPRQTSQINNPVRGVISAPPPSVSAPAGSNYVWPTAVRRITQYFGLRHTGVDIAGPIGTPLYAAKAGTVIRSQCGWNGGYGCYVILDHGGGVTTLYAHASKLYVSVGEDVEQGQVLALMGSTGRSTGPHIHFEVRVNGKRDNPLKYVR